MPSLTPLSFDILRSLAAEPLHGYGIIKSIEDRSGEDEAPSTGALYLALQRLESEAMIREAKAPRGADGRRRYWGLTRQGRAALVSEAERLAGLVASARALDLIDGKGARGG